MIVTVCFNYFDIKREIRSVKMIIHLFLIICSIFQCFTSNTTEPSNPTDAEKIWINYVVALHRVNPYPTSVITLDISFYGQIFGPDIRTTAEHAHFLYQIYLYGTR